MKSVDAALKAGRLSAADAAERRARIIAAFRAVATRKGLSEEEIANLLLRLKPHPER